MNADFLAVGVSGIQGCRYRIIMLLFFQIIYIEGCIVGVRRVWSIHMCLGGDVGWYDA